jgi:mono/diheme cytochrome c family protein
MDSSAFFLSAGEQDISALSCFSERIRAEMKAQIKQITLVLATALGLFGMVFGLLFVLQPEPVADSMPEPATDMVASTPTPAMEIQAKAGATMFRQNCAHCHGDDAKGDEGPSLYDLTRSDARIARIINEGIKGEMPKFGSKFSEADIQSLIAFLRTLKS